jgi:4-hydroxy-2-oxoglutarate aldolase
MNLHGIFPPLTVPFAADADGAPALDLLRENIERYNAASLPGYVLNGSTGESVLLTWPEIERVWATAREAAAPGKILIAGTGAESTAETIEHTNRAASLGYDAALVRTPSYYKPQMNDEGLAEHYLRVADAARIPILLYSIPVFTGVAVLAPLVARLACHQNIIGIKDSSGEVSRVTEMVAAAANPKFVTRSALDGKVRITQIASTAAASPASGNRTAPNAAQAGDNRVAPPMAQALVNRAPAADAQGGNSHAAAAAPAEARDHQMDPPRFQVLVGSASTVYPSLRAGAVGAILALACVFPELCAELCAAACAGHANRAQALQQLLTLPSAIFGRLGIPAIKYALDRQGYHGGRPRPPLLPLTPEQSREVDAVLASVANHRSATV